MNPAPFIPLLTALIEWWRSPRQAPPSPDGDPEAPRETAARKVREPSTHIGAVELATALGLFMADDQAGAWAALVVAVLGLVNVYRREKAPAP